MTDSNVRPTSLIIGDVYFSEGLDSLDKFRALLLDVKAAKPDLVVFVGDYTANLIGIGSISSHRVSIIAALN